MAASTVSQDLFNEYQVPFSGSAREDAGRSLILSLNVFAPLCNIVVISDGTAYIRVSIMNTLGAVEATTYWLG